MKNIIVKCIESSIQTKQKILDNEHIIKQIEKAADIITDSLKTGHKMVLCGNGGSASDALHFAGEIVGRFQMQREPWPAVVLNSNVSSMTAIANDYGYEAVFSRQAEAFLKNGDVLIGISTSGNSENIIKAFDIAKKKGALSVALLGKDGGEIANKNLDSSIIIPSNSTARIQESHIMIIHIICEIVEKRLSESN